MTQTRPDCFKCCLPADHSTCCFFEVGDFSKVFPALPHLEGGRGLCYPTSTSSKGNDTPTGGSCSEEQFAPEVCNRSQDSQTARCFRGTWWQEPRRVATTTLAALRPACYPTAGHVSPEIYLRSFAPSSALCARLRTAGFPYGSEIIFLH